MSKAIMQCAISIHTGVSMILIPTPTEQQETTIPHDIVHEVPPVHSSRKLQRRLKNIEVLLRGLHDQAHACTLVCKSKTKVSKSLRFNLRSMTLQFTLRKKTSYKYTD